jgi:peptidyl-tRNA hydrolase
MNLSGDAVRAWSLRNGVVVSGRPTDSEVPTAADAVVPIVVCDDLALPLGSLRIRPSGSAGGQKGIASVIACVGGESFPRVRLGVAGGDGIVAPELWSDYVLSPFAPEEKDIAAALISRAADALELLLADGPRVAAERYNRTIRPDRSLPPGH